VVWLAARYALALAALVVFLFPLYWLLVTALKTPDEIFTYPPVWWPRSPQIGNFIAHFGGSDVRAIVNSLAVALLSTVLAVGMGTAAAYAIARPGLGARLFAGWAAAARMAPPVMIAFPFFLIFAGIGWVGTMAVLILVLTAFNLPYVLWMMRGYFRDVPVALEETALVAGLTREQVFAKVVWPMARGGLLATAAFTFVLAWNELVFALVLTQGAATTLPAQLARYGEQPELWGRIAALGVAGALPIPIALGLMRRRLARSLSLGIVRG
jgi:multiple sugar transport system permease protein